MTYDLKQIQCLDSGENGVPTLKGLVLHTLNAPRLLVKKPNLMKNDQETRF